MNHKIIGLFLGIIGAIVISGLYLSMVMVEPVVENKIYEVRKDTLVTGDANPGDNSGLFYFMIYPHQAVPGTAYASNLTNASAYEYSDVGNTSCTKETPYSLKFDIVVKVGITNEDGAYTSNGTWNALYNWCLLTCADLSIGADTNMTEKLIGSTPTYAYYHYYLNNGGSGYSIIEGQTFNITSIKYFVKRIV